MITTIRVTSKTPTSSTDLIAEIKKILSINSISRIETAKVYRLEGLNKKQTIEFAKVALVEPITQAFTLEKPIFKSDSNIVEIAYKPGVMNPEVGSIAKAAADLGYKLKAADSSHEYAFWGKLNTKDLERIVERFLANETTEYRVVKKPKTLLISAQTPKSKLIPIRRLLDSNLLGLSKDRLFLNLEEMKVIQSYFRKMHRDPTDAEIEILAQSWSEHCVHKTFKAKLTIDGKQKAPLITRIKQTAKYNPKLIVSAFDDNSGVIDFYDGYAINGKVETHNSPSAIEPYGGAMTGSGGVFRDILGTGKGAKPVASTDIFCFAPPDLDPAKLPPGCLPSDYLLRRVVYGVRDYGNRVGIPTNNGSVHFHEDFRAKPTVAVGSFGIIKKSLANKGKVHKGDLIFTIGGRTGRDGIHGATFSSGEMTDRTMVVSGSAVQIGNAIEEKRVIDAVLEMSDANLLQAITDCGAGGFSSAIGEMGAQTGALVNLEKVPLKYPGLAPWEIFVSESQERMILAITPKNKEKVLAIAKKYNVEIVEIGKFTSDKKLKLFFNKTSVAMLDMEFIHNGLPQRHMVGTSISKSETSRLPKPASVEKIWTKILAHPNVCSKEPIVRMYDHNVQGTAALHPFSGVNLDGPNDGSIMQPILGKPHGLVISHGLNPVMNSIDPFKGSIWAVAEAVSNFVSIGGDLTNAGLIDNFIWPFPDEESLAELDKSVDACTDMAKILKMPFVSGKDSLSSTYRYKDGKVLKIPPVLLISVFGKIPDVKKTTSADFKSTDSTIVLVGKSDFVNLGGTTYFDITKSTQPTVPNVDIKNLRSTLASITKAIQSGKILSVHDISEGGIAAALSEMCFGGDCGAKIDISGLGSVPNPKFTPGVSLKNKGRTLDRPDFILFAETPGTFLVEVASKKIANRLFAKVPYTTIGNTQASKTIKVTSGKKSLANLDIDKLKAAWQNPMKEIFK